VKDKRLDGISDLRDETDRNGMRIVIELKKDANGQVVLNNLFKQTALQSNFSIIMLALGSLSALGYGPLAGVTVFGMQFLDFFDFLTNSVMMPIAAIATCLLVSRVVGVERIEQEVTREGKPFRRQKVFNFMVRYLCPIFAVIILVSSVANALGWIAM